MYYPSKLHRGLAVLGNVDVESAFLFFTRCIALVNKRVPRISLRESELIVRGHQLGTVHFFCGLYACTCPGGKHANFGIGSAPDVESDYLATPPQFRFPETLLLISEWVRTIQVDFPVAPVYDNISRAVLHALRAREDTVHLGEASQGFNWWYEATIPPAPGVGRQSLLGRTYRRFATASGKP